MVEKILSRSVRLMFAGSVAVGLGMIAQTAIAQEAQRVEITGSSIKRVDSETALPVQVISKAEIARTGATSTQELLGSISALSSSGSTNNAKGAGTSTGGLSSISLRGLGDERTLILVNGRRLAAFAGSGGAVVNVNVIPLSAIERIEVLKDGASGVYGSDAVAGVVNFILSKSMEGIDITAGYGSPTATGGGQNQKVAITGGIGNLQTDGYSAVLSASFEKEKVLFGRDRDYASKATVLPYFNGTATGLGNIQGTWTPGTGANAGFSQGGSGYGNPLAAQNKCDTIQMELLPKSAKGAPYCYYNSAPNVGLIPDRELANLTGNFTFKLNADHELFADALYSRSKVTQTYQPSPARASFFATDSLFAAQNVDPALLLYPSNPVYASLAQPYLLSRGFASLVNGKPLAITARVFDFGPRQNVDTATQSRMVIGSKGTIANQDYEVGLSANESKLTSSVTTGYFSQVAYAKIINDPASNWNPWAVGGVQTGALADKIKTSKFSGDFLGATSKSNTLDGKISGDLFKLGGLQSLYAAGFQSRRESYATAPSADYQSGDIAGLGGQQVPIDRSRTVNSFFGEVIVPVTKDLDGTVAVRNDRYNDVGASTNYKASARWQPSKSALFRASVGTGFRAPTLSDLWTPQTLGTSEAFNDPATNQSGLQVTQVSGGNPNLKPEKSKQYSVGMVLQPTSNTSVGVDLFNVEIKDILSTPSAQEVVSGFRRGDPAYASLVTLTGADVTLLKSILANTGNATVQGLDVFATWRDTFSFGRLDLAINGTYTNKYDQTSPGGDVFHKVGTLVTADGSPVIGAQNGGVILRWKHQLAGTWTAGAWATTLVQNYRTGYEVGHDLNDERVFVRSEPIYDANVTFKGIKNVTLALGIKNLMDKKPDIVGQAVTNQFQAGFDSSQFDPRGRFVYVTAGYRFK